MASIELFDEIIKRQEELNQCLKELAKIPPTESDLESQNQVKDIGEKIVELYIRPFSSGDDFAYRHLYSSFLPNVMNDLSDEELDCLVAYLREILCAHQNDHTLFLSLLKLYDHITLDISRSQYIKRNETLDDKIEQSFCKLDGVNKEIKELQTSFEKTNDKIVAIEKTADTHIVQIISVLGIFSAIIVVFTGGLAYIGESLGALGSVSTREVAVLVMICGAIMYDLILLLLYFIGSVSKSVFLTEKKERYVVAILPNTVLFVSIVIVIGSMYFV